MEEEILKKLLKLFHEPFKALREGRMAASEVEEVWRTFIEEMAKLGMDVRDRMEEIIKLAHEYENTNEKSSKARIESKIINLWAGPNGPSDAIWGYDP